MQSVGAVLIISGSLILSFYHQKVDLYRMLWLVTSLALLYLPYYIVKKMAIDDGVNPATVFFWMIFAREIFSFSLPWFFPKVRHIAINTMRMSWHFMAINAAVIVCFFLAEYAGTLAYKHGPLSLVAIVSNIQPFMVMGLAGLVVFFVPSKAPKELLTRQSVKLKILCFLIVFTGLALIADF